MNVMQQFGMAIKMIGQWRATPICLLERKPYGGKDNLRWFPKDRNQFD